MRTDVAAIDHGTVEPLRSAAAGVLVRRFAFIRITCSQHTKRLRLAPSVHRLLAMHHLMMPHHHVVVPLRPRRHGHAMSRQHRVLHGAFSALRALHHRAILHHRHVTSVFRFRLFLDGNFLCRMGFFLRGPMIVSVDGMRGPHWGRDRKPATDAAMNIRNIFIANSFCSFAGCARSSLCP